MVGEDSNLQAFAAELRSAALPLDYPTIKQNLGDRNRTCMIQFPKLAGAITVHPGEQAQRESNPRLAVDGRAGYHYPMGL